MDAAFRKKWSSCIIQQDSRIYCPQHGKNHSDEQELKKINQKRWTSRLPLLLYFLTAKSEKFFFLRNSKILFYEFFWFWFFLVCFYLQICTDNLTFNTEYTIFSTDDLASSCRYLWPVLPFLLSKLATMLSKLCDQSH